MKTLTVRVFEDESDITLTVSVPEGLDDRFYELIAKGLLYEADWCQYTEHEWKLS
jgi:hypothetical protein